MAGLGDLAPWFDRWCLIPDGEPFVTLFGSCLAPVKQDGVSAMLKIAGGPEERDGAALMAWWSGDGAARVLAHEGDALLLERAPDPGTLADLPRAGADDSATRILCNVAAGLHRPRPPTPPPTLKPLDVWFRALWTAGEVHGGPFARAAQAAQSLISAAQAPCVLHGDLHHDNILSFGDRGWLAIDPKGLIGERGFDFANLFCNPWPEADDPDRFARRLRLTCELANLEPARQLNWIVAYTGLSAAWTVQSGGDPWRALRIGDYAAVAAGL